MKNKYKATPKTYASQARRNGKVTANLVNLLARADVHVEEKELKSISTEPDVRAPTVYASGGVVGFPRHMNEYHQLLNYVNRDVEVIQGHNRALAMGRLYQTHRFDPPVNVRAGEELLLGTGRLFIGSTDDPDNMREIGIARDVRVDLASGRDSMALVQMDFAGAEARVIHNYTIQSLISEQMVRELSARIDEEIMRGAGQAARDMSASISGAAVSASRLSDATLSTTLTIDSLSEAFSRMEEVISGGRRFGRRYIAVMQENNKKKKKKKKPPVHPDAGKTVVLRKTRRTLLGVVVSDVRVRSGAIKRTSQLGQVVQNHRRRRNGAK